MMPWHGERLPTRSGSEFDRADSQPEWSGGNISALRQHAAAPPGGPPVP